MTETNKPNKYSCPTCGFTCRLALTFNQHKCKDWKYRIEREKAFFEELEQEYEDSKENGR